MISIPSVDLPVSTRYVGCWKSDSKLKLLINTEDFIGLEISLVPQVELVFVDRESKGKEYRVLTVINDRDPELRKSIYARERAIIEEYPHFDFDFHIVARTGRDLSTVVTPSGKLAFKR